MPKVWHHLRGLPHGGEHSGRASPDVFVGTTDKEDQWRRKCHTDYQGRQIKESSGQTKDHQREILLLPSTRESTRKTYMMMGVPSCVTEELL